MNNLNTNRLLDDAMSNLKSGFEQSIISNDDFNPDFMDDRWTGKVIDNNDPDKLGRVKVLIFGYYDELAENALPWAIPDLSYVGGTNGNFVIPEIGTILRGYFDQDDIQKPIFDSVAFSQATAQDTTKNPLINKLEDYPNKMVLMETDQGEYLTLNKKTGETEFKHRSGMSFTIDANGSITVYTGENYSERGRLTINTEGNADINVGGDANVKAKMNVNIDADGEVNLGKNPMKQLCNNIPVCMFTGIRHNIGNTNTKC